MAECSAKASRTLAAEITGLLTHRRERDRRRVFFAEGVRNFVQAADAGMSFERVLYSERLLINAVARKLVRRMRRAGVKTEALSPEEFRQISRAERASGVAAIVNQRWANLTDISPNDGLSWVLLDRVRSPGNLGTLIRSSKAAGGAGFILIGPDPYSPAVVRAAMGALYQQVFVASDWPAVRAWVAANGVPVVGASPDGSVDLHGSAWPDRPPLLVLGDERKGLSAEQTGLCDRSVRIPMTADTDSLNLGVAGSLMLYEVLRARGPLVRPCGHSRV